jgi:hypothetical protein
MRNLEEEMYSVYSTYVDEDERAAGGSTILVRDNVLHSYVNLNTNLQAVAVRISWERKSSSFFPLSVVILLPHKGLCPLKSPMMMNGVDN